MALQATPLVRSGTDAGVAAGAAVYVTAKGLEGRQKLTG